MRYEDLASLSLQEILEAVESITSPVTINKILAEAEIVRKMADRLVTVRSGKRLEYGYCYYVVAVLKVRMKEIKKKKRVQFQQPA